MLGSSGLVASRWPTAKCLVPTKTQELFLKRGTVTRRGWEGLAPNSQPARAANDPQAPAKGSKQHPQ